MKTGNKTSDKITPTALPKVRSEKPKSLAKEHGFFENVYDVVRQIPKGRVTSYGAVANFLGTKMSARMVGWAMNSAHSVTPPVPAHRVVNRNGMLSGKAHFGLPDKMEKLLKKEKIPVKDDVIIGFKDIFWDPAKELAID